VSLQSFKELMAGVYPRCTVMSRNTLVARIEDRSNKVVAALKQKLREVEFVATTAYCWSVQHRSSIGLTVHWIRPDDLGRESAILACRRLKGHHTHSVLAESMEQIHMEYGIVDKICKATTDNGANFIKAFECFQRELETADDEEVDIAGGQSIAIDDMLEGVDETEFQLPPHQRCACHLLNLVASSDSTKTAESNEDGASYVKLFRSAFAKCQGLWNKTGRSCIAAETVTETCDRQLIRPNDTRWNSTYDAVERLIVIAEEKGPDSLHQLCESFNLPK